MRWVEMRVEVANKEIVGACARDAWRAVREIEKGWGIGREDSALHLRKNDNTLCISNEENAEVFAEHFTELYNIPSTFDQRSTFGISKGKTSRAAVGLF